MKNKDFDADLSEIMLEELTDYTANKLAVLSTAFGSVTFPTVIWLYTELLMAVHSQWLY